MDIQDHKPNKQKHKLTEFIKSVVSTSLIILLVLMVGGIFLSAQSGNLNLNAEDSHVYTMDNMPTDQNEIKEHGITKNLDPKFPASVDASTEKAQKQDSQSAPEPKLPDDDIIKCDESARQKEKATLNTQIKTENERHKSALKSIGKLENFLNSVSAGMLYNRQKTEDTTYKLNIERMGNYYNQKITKLGCHQ